MKKILITFFVFCLIGVLINSVAAQTSAEKPEVPAANPADVASPEAIIKAVYDLISGGVGQKRDWDRFRTLFYKDAKMIPTGKSRKTGITGAHFYSIEEYIEAGSPYMEKEGFFEKEIAHKTEIYGNIAQVFSSYESFNKADDKTPFERGINGFQLFNDGKRWWILNIMWLGETKENPLPQQYLKNR